MTSENQDYQDKNAPIKWSKSVRTPREIQRSEEPEKRDWRVGSYGLNAWVSKTSLT